MKVLMTVRSQRFLRIKGAHQNVSDTSKSNGKALLNILSSYSGSIEQTIFLSDWLETDQSDFDFSERMKVHKPLMIPLECPSVRKAVFCLALTENSDLCLWGCGRKSLRSLA
jgi:hypothetical protein